MCIYCKPYVRRKNAVCDAVVEDDRVARLLAGDGAASERTPAQAREAPTPVYLGFFDQILCKLLPQEGDIFPI